MASPTLAALLLALASPAMLAAQTWVPVGPTGGDVRALTRDPRDPRIIYLGTADGVLYRSDDAGLAWRRLSPGFPLRGQSLDEIAVDRSGAVLVGYWEVAGNGGGVARSRDGGQHFRLLPQIAGQSVRALAIAPSNPAVIVAGALSGVFRSDDGGETWRRLSPEGHAELRNVESVAIAPAEPSTLYVGTWHLPWKTQDGGRTWRRIDAGIVNDSDIFTLTLDHRSADTVYATACTGIYRSGDAGGRWSKVRGIPGSSRRTRCFAQHPNRPDTLYAGTTEGLWVTTDGAASWRLVTAKDLVVNAVLTLPEDTLLLGCEGAGVLRSTDGGVHWAAVNEGFSERLVSRVAFDSTSGRMLVGVVGDRRDGVLTAPSPRGPWVPVGNGLEGREVLALVLAGVEALAGTDDGVFLSVSHCGIWRRLPTIVSGLDLHPRVTDLVLLDERTILAATSQGLLRSADLGQTWAGKTLGSATQVVALAASTRPAGSVLAATPLGLHRSADRGATWELVSAGPADPRIRTLAFLPGDDRAVFATTPTGLFKSRDQGRGWSWRGAGLPASDITGLALHPDGHTLYVSDFSRGGLFVSEDAGETWRPFPTDGLASDRVFSLALDPAAPARILAAAATGGLHLFTPGPPIPGSPW